jgi:hypothetical protein
MFLAIYQYNQTYLLKTNFPRKELLEIFCAFEAQKISIDEKGIFLKTIYPSRKYKNLLL